MTRAPLRSALYSSPSRSLIGWGLDSYGRVKTQCTLIGIGDLLISLELAVRSNSPESMPLPPELPG